jgi:hypothetical protein
MEPEFTGRPRQWSTQLTLLTPISTLSAERRREDVLAGFGEHPTRTMPAPSSSENTPAQEEFSLGFSTLDTRPFVR